MTLLLPTTVGGHITELMELSARVAFGGPRLWMTWRNPQTESLLAGEDVVWVDPVQPRDVRGVLLAARATRRVLRDRGCAGVAGRRRGGTDIAPTAVTAVMTTGSGIALGVLPVCAARRIPCHFVESATRPDGPGMTAKLLRPVPGVRLYTQFPHLASKRWLHRGSVFDGYQTVARSGAGTTIPAGTGVAPAPSVRRVVVTLGTMEDYRFGRLLSRLCEIVPADAEVLWQTGCTPVDGLRHGGRPVAGRAMVPADELLAAMAEADVVVGHCGVGTTLTAMNAGHFGVLVPREAVHGENVDDHQVTLATELARLGLAATPRVDDLDLGVLESAAARAVERVAAPPPFVLA
jgi:UDP-N-acetylglucosamine--N-acetylmuramyl-(pentapeptide) pyrophosphoryl-undecaprenol N-acetylglucosamine transferase